MQIRLKNIESIFRKKFSEFKNLNIISRVYFYPVPFEQIIDSALLAETGNLELLAKQVVEGFIIGLHKSPFHGFSVEFAEHRLYNPGESTRHMDWKVLARSDKMFVKKYEEETNLRCHIVMDVSSSMFYPSEQERKQRKILSKIQFSAVAAAAIMELLKKQRDAFALHLFSGEIEMSSAIRSTTQHHRQLIAQLEALLKKENEQKKTSAADAIHLIAESIHRRSLVVLFTDMLDDAMGDDEQMEKLFESLQHLRYNKHEVILFYVVDKKRELDFEFENRPYQFVDLETGEKIKLQPSELKKNYTEKMKKLEREIKLRCGQNRIDLIEADINQGFQQILTPYLLKRTRLQ